MSEKWIKTNVVDVENGVLNQNWWVQIQDEKIGYVGP